VPAPTLTLDLLERLRGGWIRQRAPVADHLRPGLPTERIDEMTAALGLRLPVEARTWWSWHDGVDVALGTVGELGPGLPFLPLENAVDLCRLFREQAGVAWGDQAEQWWRPSWFPITERLGAIRCDCAVETGAPTPIFYADSHDYDAEGLTKPRVESFGTMVTWWVEALESGAWRYDATARRWERQADHLLPERQTSHLL
jgi:hypothetical protein